MAEICKVAGTPKSAPEGPLIDTLRDDRMITGEEFTVTTEEAVVIAPVESDTLSMIVYVPVFEK
jgi:hypothetical protein